tara:strand:+ start:1428 stop:1772 length:345 start_codon:yes stop_codon:yes gene_type:complete
MDFRSTRAENFLGKKPNYGAVADQAMTSASKETQAQLFADARIEAAKLGLQGTKAAADATAFSGMVGGISSGISGGLGAMGKSSGYTNNPGAKISDPTADIQKALGPGVKFGMY